MDPLSHVTRAVSLASGRRRKRRSLTRRQATKVVFSIGNRRGWVTLSDSSRSVPDIRPSDSGHLRRRIGESGQTRVAIAGRWRRLRGGDRSLVGRGSVDAGGGRDSKGRQDSVLGRRPRAGSFFCGLSYPYTTESLHGRGSDYGALLVPMHTNPLIKLQRSVGVPARDSQLLVAA